MKIVTDYPPNYEDVKKAFRLRIGEGIIFTYGNTIYNPDYVALDNHLIEHERTHERQQAKITPEKWWERYLIDPEFRLSQELEAYRKQYNYLKRHHNRSYLRRIVPQMCQHLASYIYGNLVTREQAKQLITGAV